MAALSKEEMKACNRTGPGTRRFSTLHYPRRMGYAKGSNRDKQRRSHCTGFLDQIIGIPHLICFFILN
jgi:hypothetical protein